ncbi:MAG: histidine kinase dimerization/phosphoacceptor domain -containing protein [Balneolaceae bacterium]
MKLSTKLLLSYFSVAFLVLLVGSGSYLLNRSIQTNLIDQSQDSVLELQQLSDLAFHLQNSLLYTRNYLIESQREREAGPGELRVQSRTAEQVVRGHLTQFQVNQDSLQAKDFLDDGSPETMSESELQLSVLIDSLETSFDFYQSLLLELFELEEEGMYGEEVYNTTIEPYFRTTMLPILERLRESQREAVQVQMDGIRSRAERTGSFIFLITLVGFIVAICLAYLMYRSLARPIRYLTEATEEIGAGNLDKRININTKDELQILGDSFNRMTENLNKSMVSREYVNNIIQSMGDMLFVTDSAFTIRLINRATTDTLGYSEKELIGTSIWDLFSENSISDVKDRVMTRSGHNSFENVFQTLNKKKIPVIISFSGLGPVPGGGNQPGVVFVASNITAQKEAEEKINSSLREKEVLLAEIHHRVKNNLAVISGLLEMQVWNLEADNDSIPALKESQMRIQSIALVHELLYQSETFAEVKLDEYIIKLLEAIEKTHKQDDKSIRIQMDLEEVVLTIQEAIPASLLLNEIVVNSFKHAFAGRREGLINVSLTEEESIVRLTVQDNGIGLPDGFDPLSQHSLGMTLINTLSQQINADLIVGRPTEYPAGALFTIEFSLKPLPEA